MPSPRTRSTLLAFWLFAGTLITGDGTGETVAPRPVVVELFTSQGCSSCPAADRLLAVLAADGLDGVPVLPLAFHVDYWNYIGWTDPFSAGEWSRRQRRYAARLAGEVYTPQLVVGGRAAGVGSDSREVRRLIAGAADRPAGASVDLRPGGAAAPSVALEVTLDRAAGGGADLLLAVFESGLTTEVRSGENARRTLRNDYVVRRLRPLARLAPGDTLRLDVPLDLDPAWRRDRLGVVVFVQGVESLEILGAGSIRL